MPNVTPISIRDVRSDDAADVANILNCAIEARVFTVFDTPLTIDAERRYIKAFPERGVFLVAVLSDRQKVVGFQSMEPFASYTRAFDHVGVLGTYVDLDYRRQGIAKALFAATFAQAVVKGYGKIFTYIRADNPASLATYLNQGFRIVGTARGQARIEGRYIDEIIVERILDAAVERSG